jgi:2-polyprenyl-3-methyl-5-hydroxy-6-metoxy-1,4-benzoquinol methylase
MEYFNKSYVGLRKDLLTHIVGRNLKVLGVGFATGGNGIYLKDKKIARWVTGIEFNKEMALIAKEGNDSVFCANLNSEFFRAAIIEEPYNYDVNIFGDILEHLYEPEVVVRVLTIIFSKNQDSHHFFAQYSV